jgi:phage terminase large subunit
MDLNIQASEVFEWNYGANKRFVINCGGTRSGKTYSILQVLIVKVLQSQDPLLISIVRKTLPSLKKSILRDFVEILQSMGLYNDADHNKSDNIYRLNGSVFEFFSIDNAQKYRGSKRDILYLNEANEFNYEDVFQLQIRTTQQVYIDYNPSFESGWIYDIEEQRKDEVDFFRSTYLNNPFLEQSLVDEIERLKDTDADYWTIYGLGERGRSMDLIYQFHEVDEIPTDKAEFVAIGLDWGFSNDPTTAIEVWKHDNTLYLNELLYKRGLTNSDIAEELRALGVDKRIDIVCDSAEPKSIEELRRFGYRTHPAKKGPDSILNGIDILKRHRICVTSDSLNLVTELSRYKWMKDVNGTLLNRPTDAYNHALDAVRYVALNMLSQKKRGQYNISITGAGKATPVTNNAIREWRGKIL